MWWIHKPRQKTAVMSRIPLLETPLAILRRYEDDATSIARGRLLPTPSNQKMNSYLKEIAAICGIEKVLTTHLRAPRLAKLSGQRNYPLYFYRRDTPLS